LDRFVSGTNAPPASAPFPVPQLPLEQPIVSPGT
jgi:hypothetical protein